MKAATGDPAAMAKILAEQEGDEDAKDDDKKKYDEEGMKLILIIKNWNIFYQ